MRRRPVTTRLAFITTASLSVASAVGSVAEAVATHFHHEAGAGGHAAAAVIAIWVFDKLNNLIDDKE
ncbi:hypothetical protein [Micromonospora sp. NPDC051141]|uniref:hypothetical protein n=1 Tax=Micromonospora sp. NPDC051141 TaxID=3364284 RepID=UPI0037A7738E